MALQILNAQAIEDSQIDLSPYPHFLGQGGLREEVIPSLRSGFPQITKPGFLTVDDLSLAPPFRQLIDDMESPELTEILSSKFGLDLHPFPRLTTVRRLSQRKDGRIHTDGPSKVMTVLLYLNDDWAEDENGRLRVLYDGKHFEPFACEIPPVMGTFFGFLRSDQSWHGHKPFTGERRVVQTAWISDADQLERKKSRNAFAKVMKAIFGR